MAAPAAAAVPDYREEMDYLMDGIEEEEGVDYRVLDAPPGGCIPELQVREEFGEFMHEEDAIDLVRMQDEEEDDGITDRLVAMSKEEQLAEDGLTDLKRRVKLTKDALELLRSCRTHLEHPDLKATKRVDDDGRERMQLELRWRRDFLGLSEEMPRESGDMNLAPGDIVFHSLCIARVCELDADHRQDVILFHLLETWTRLVVIACQHTLGSRHYWPSQKDWRLLRFQIAAVVHHFFVGQNAIGLARLRKCFESYDDKEGKEQMANFAAKLDINLRRQYLARRVPPALAEKRRAEKQKAEEDRRKGKTSKADAEVAEEHQGALWRNSPDELVRGYCQLAARVIHCVELDETLAAQFPLKDEPPTKNAKLSTELPTRLPQFNPQTRKCIMLWLRAKCALQQPDETSALFRDTANTMFQPLGTSTRKFRVKRLKNDITDPHTMLQDELGAELGGLLYEQSLIDIGTHVRADVKTTGETLHFDAILLALFDSSMRQRFKLDWIKQYCALDPHTAEWQARMKSRYYMGAPKRPILVWVKRRWCLLHRHQLQPCQSLLHAIVGWMYLVREQYKCRLENTENITPIITELLPRDCTQAAA